MSTSDGAYVETESRRSERFRVDSLSYIDLGQSNGGMVIGVSETGLSFQGVQPLDSSQQLPISFKLPGMKQSVKGTGQIIWLNDSRKGGGLQFVEMMEECQTHLKEWLEGRMSPDVTEEAETVPSEEAVANPEKPSDECRSEPKTEEPPEFRRKHEEALRRLSASSLEPSGGSPSTGQVGLAVSRAHAAFVAAIPNLANPPADTERDAGRRAPRDLSKFALWLLTGAAAIGVVGAGSFLALRERPAHEPTVVSESGDDFLGLKLERQGADWQISWDRNAESVLKAIGGHLSITDGQSRRDVDLEPSELRSGSVLYTPLTNDVLVRLQLVGGNSDSPVSESVRVMGGAEGASAAEKQGNQASSRNPNSSSSRASSGNFAAAQRQGTAPRQLIALDLRTPHPASGSATPPAAADPGAKDFAASDSAGPLTTSMTRGIGLNLPPAPAPARPDPPTNLPSRNASTLVPAQLISGKDPIFPESARGMGISGTVDVHFRIERDGHVSDATVVKGNPLLGRAALDAVLARRYRPATLGSKPVESESDARFVFNPN
jgi:TonB family protein